MSELKALPTPYKGFEFRSRLEAKWAYFFDLIGVRWLYENEGFDLDAGWYLPDFWLPDINGGSFIEIKPKMPDQSELNKYGELAAKSGKYFFLLFSDEVEVGGQTSSCEGYVYVDYDEENKTGHAYDYMWSFCKCPTCAKVGIQYLGYGGRNCKCNEFWDKARCLDFEHTLDQSAYEANRKKFI